LADLETGRKRCVELVERRAEHRVEVADRLVPASSKQLVAFRCGIAPEALEEPRTGWMARRDLAEAPLERVDHDEKGRRAGARGIDEWDGFVDPSFSLVVPRGPSVADDSAILLGDEHVGCR